MKMVDLRYQTYAGHRIDHEAKAQDFFEQGFARLAEEQNSTYNPEYQEVECQLQKGRNLLPV